MDKFAAVDFSIISITDGFWAKKQTMNEETTIYAIYDRFMESGRFDAFHFEKTLSGEVCPHIFWDSDVAKWIEAAAYIIQHKPSAKLEKTVDDIVDLIVAQQTEDGYFNSYFQTKEPENRFKRRYEHELYCAGHLMEAAIAYYQATGKDKMLKAMCRYADLIYQIFVIDHSSAFETPGHEEIELALVKFYHCTGNRKYLELGKYFVDARGNGHDQDFYDFANASYSQDHLPVREQTTAEGHSVRAVYLYAAMADLAYEYNDKALINACTALFDNIMQKRMYITGGIGSSKTGEAFTVDYDLPNLTAYSESCAAIGLMLFANRMLKLELNSKYSDLIERILYNGFLSSVSLDGRSFFYLNPLEITPWMRHRDVSTKAESPLPITQRVELFDCSCCPPNIARMLASVGNLIYTQDDSTLYLHQYISNRLSLDGTILSVQSELPVSGKISIHVSGDAKKRLAMRIPSWQRGYQLTVNGKAFEASVRNGYLFVQLTGAETEISLIYSMAPVFVRANPMVSEDCGKVALTYGPVVYCLEEIDNGENLSNCFIDLKNTEFQSTYDPRFGFNRVQCQGLSFPVHAYDELYRYISDRENMQSRRLNFIPYCCFSNRGETGMAVWIKEIRT